MNTCDFRNVSYRCGPKPLRSELFKRKVMGFRHFQIGKTDVERLALPIRNVLLRNEIVTKLGTHARW